MSTKSEYESVLSEATRKRCVSELKLQATITFYQTSCMEEDNEKMTQYRSEIHALQDIVLDCIGTQMYCIGK